MKLYGQTARIAWRAPSFGARYQSTVAPRRSRLKVGAAPFFLNAPPIEDSEGGSTLSFIQSTTALAPPATPVAVRSRYGLPGAARPATNTMLPEFLAAPSADFPKVIDAAPLASAHDSASRWAKALHGELDRLLPRHGAVVVHGLEEVVGNVEGFTRFMAAIKVRHDLTKISTLPLCIPLSMPSSTPSVNSDTCSDTSCATPRIFLALTRSYRILTRERTTGCRRSTPATSSWRVGA
jgi:hypothetical protein